MRVVLYGDNFFFFLEYRIQKSEVRMVKIALIVKLLTKFGILYSIFYILYSVFCILYSLF